MTEKYLSDSEIVKAISGINRAAGRIKDQIHNTAMSICYHWQNAGDNYAAAALAAERLNALQNASPYHANAFAFWVKEFLPLTWVKDHWAADASKGSVRLFGKAFLAAKAKPFWEVKPATKANPFDLGEKLNALVSTTDKHIKDAKEGDVIDLTLHRVLKEIQRRGAKDILADFEELTALRDKAMNDKAGLLNLPYPIKSSA